MFVTTLLVLVIKKLSIANTSIKIMEDFPKISHILVFLKPPDLWMLL